MDYTDYLDQVLVDVVNQQIDNPLSFIVGNQITKLGLTSTDRRLKVAKFQLTQHFYKILNKRRNDKDAQAKHKDLFQNLLDYNTNLK